MISLSKSRLATLLFVVAALASSNALTRGQDSSKQNTKKELNNVATGNKTAGQTFDGRNYVAPVRPQTSTTTVTAAQIAAQQNKIPANQPPKRQGPSIDHINVPSTGAPRQNQGNPTTSKTTPQTKKTNP